MSQVNLLGRSYLIKDSGILFFIRVLNQFLEDKIAIIIRENIKVVLSNFLNKVLYHWLAILIAL